MDTVFAAYMSSPCHIELILSEKEEPVKKEVFDSSSFVDPPPPFFLMIHYLIPILFLVCSPRLS